MKNNIIINDFSIDHVVINIDKNYQEDKTIIEKIKASGLFYEPSKGKGTRGFKASNIWIGDEYLELIQIKTKDGGGWRKNWVEKYNSGHRGVIGLFLKTENIENTGKLLKDFQITSPERIVFPMIFNLVHISAKWRNSYLPFLSGVPLQLGFQQVDNKKIEANMRKRMQPNSEKNGFFGIKTIKFFGDFSIEDFETIKKIFSCNEITENHIEIPLNNEQYIHFYIDTINKTQIFIDSKNKDLVPLEIENVLLLSKE